MRCRKIPSLVRSSPLQGLSRNLSAMPVAMLFATLAANDSAALVLNIRLVSLREIP